MILNRKSYADGKVKKMITSATFWMFVILFTTHSLTAEARFSIFASGQQSAAQQQTRRVTGKVTDEKAEPLPGVNVVVKGTTTGVVTDFDGNYALNVPENAVLVFSFEGYIAQEVTVTNQAVINIQLREDIRGFDEVVVIGYGTQRKVNLTGSVAVVNIDEQLTSRSLTNVSTGLSGLMPGLSISQNSGMAGKNDVSLLVRGLGTVNNANPLIVVDGMPDVDINRLNMNDIESISVLKDATSSAVYGSRAANGVILITTKTGRGQDKSRINFQSSYVVDTHPL